MNKLGALLFLILLGCGALLWGLAPESFNQYIKEEIQTLSSTATQHQVAVGQVNVQAEQGYASISQLQMIEFHAQNLAATNSSKNLADLPLIHVDEINIALNPKTLRQETIVINELAVNGVTLNLDQARNEIAQVDLEALINLEALLTKTSKLISENLPNNEIDSNAVKFQVKAIVVNNITVHLNHSSELKKPLTLTDIRLDFKQSWQTDSKKISGYSKQQITALLYHRIIQAIVLQLK